MPINKLGGEYYSDDELHAAGFMSIGENVKIHNRSSIYCPENISIGDNVVIQDFVVIVATGRVEIDDNVEINCFSYIGGTYGVCIGKYVTLAPGVRVFSVSDDYSGKFLMHRRHFLKEHMGKDIGQVTIKDYAIIGVDSVVMPNIEIGIGASVGAMSFVTQDLHPWSINCGCPAKKIGNRKKDMLDYLESDKS